MRNRIGSILVLLSLCTLSVSADDALVGRWKGWIRAGDETVITVDFTGAADRPEATFEALVEGKVVRGRFEVRRDGDRITLQTPGGGSVSEGTLRGDVIAGSYRNNRTGSRGTFRLEKVVASTPETRSGTIQELSIPAPSLRGNLLGDPAEQRAAIYLPPGYNESGTRRYPVLYLLHGIGGSYADWTRVWNIAPIMDRLIARRRIEEFMIVMPNGTNRYVGSYYANSPVIGRWQDYITDDVVAFVDQRFRTRANARSRAIAGHSMGGFGALNIAMGRPEVFGSVYAISPCCLANVEDISYGNPAWHTALAFKQPADLDAALAKGDFYPVAMIALTAAFTPASDRPPLFVKLPVRIERGELMPNEAYEEWLEHFPLRQLPKYRASLQRLRGLHLEFGIDDQFAHVPVATRQFSSALAEYRIPHTLAVHSGDHRSQMAERLETIILPAISADLTE